MFWKSWKNRTLAVFFTFVTISQGHSKRVFFIFDDSFITKIDINKLNVVFEAAIKYDLDSVALLKKKFDIGAKVSISKYQNGDIYVGAGYMGIPYAHIGLSWNLFCNDWYIL